MLCSVEISMYPLKEDFKPSIIAFINNLKKYSFLKVDTNGMSTQVFGEYDLATAHVMAEIKHVHQTLDTAVFIVKFIGGDRSVVQSERQCIEEEI